MKRREFLYQSALGSLGLGLSLSSFHSAFGIGIKKPLLILIELKGGNDGLNTLIPFAQSQYYKLRPNIGIEKEKILRLNHEVGLHPALQNLKSFKNRAIIQGIGYEDPNLSHFRSIDIWETGSNSSEVLESGWLARSLNPQEKGFILGSNNFGPLRGKNSQILSFNKAESFLKQGSRFSNRMLKNKKTKNSALDHIMNVEASITKAVEEIKKIETPNELKYLKKPKGKLSQSIEVLLKLVADQKNIGVYKLTLGSFDTHVNQENTHERLLKELDESLTYLASGLQKLGLWNQSLISTYSEFGRRAKENKNRGTDHGTANTHFVLGGKVKSGIYGDTPNLNDLINNNLKYKIDYRSLYSEILKEHLNIKRKVFDKEFKKVGFLG